jgi:hypothetical protein
MLFFFPQAHREIDWSVKTVKKRFFKKIQQIATCLGTDYLKNTGVLCPYWCTSFT